jgi:hypothetical protein
MPTSLKFILSADAAGFDKGLKQVQASSAQAAANINRELSRASSPAYINILNTAKQQLTVENEINQAVTKRARLLAALPADTNYSGYKRYGGGSDGRYGRASLQAGSAAMVAPMFISVARDSFASLASGQNPITVMMQQGPQVAQAMTMMSGGIMGAAATLGAALLPVAAGLAALAPVIYVAKVAFDTFATNRMAAQSGAEADVMRGNLAANTTRALFQNRDKLKPGEAEELIKNIRGSSGNEQREALIAARERLREIFVSPEQIAAMGEMGRMTSHGFRAALNPFDQRREAAAEEYRNQQADLEAKAKLDQRPGFQQMVQTAYAAIRTQNQATLKQIDEDEAAANAAMAAKAAKTATTKTKTDRLVANLTDQERHGGSLGATVSLLDVNKSMDQTLKRIYQKMDNRTKTARGVNFGGGAR